MRIFMLCVVGLGIIGFIYNVIEAEYAINKCLENHSRDVCITTLH